MQRQRLMWMARLVCLGMLVGALQACTTTEEAPKPASAKAAEAERAPISEEAWLDPRLDGVFVVPGVDFSRYRSLLVPTLNLDQWRPLGQELPLQELNRNDEQFIRQTYTETLVHTLVMQGGYELAMEPGPGVLEVRGRLQQGLQASDEGSLPRGAVVMLLNLDLHDSESGELVAALSQRQPLARSLNERASQLTAMQIQQAFLDWMEWFRRELDVLRSGS
ncbi:DUF3313 family protein [Marinimicrobium agarilyticum]|uniref:DUF3313 family protein n=1 Tax=Marinimicrobium agarilyticum TaxID=306546 RepID=UPI00040AA1E8|nr:DUF3313 family protein [Marinimicrobium agarilyticum]